MLLLNGKLVHFVMFVCLMSILGPPVVGSSAQQHVKPPVGLGKLADKKGNIHKVDHKLMFEVKLHGFLLWASMGFFMPVAILAIRMSNMQECGRRLKILFYVHQILSLLLATAGAVMSVKNFNDSFNNHHQRLGLALYGTIWLQALTGVLRPSRGDVHDIVEHIEHKTLSTGDQKEEVDGFLQTGYWELQCQFSHFSWIMKKLLGLEKRQGLFSPGTDWYHIKGRWIWDNIRNPVTISLQVVSLLRKSGGLSLCEFVMTCKLDDCLVANLKGNLSVQILKLAWTGFLYYIGSGTIGV
ncbi:Cytochrome b561 domain-containing protein [Hibiscus syriacus]|uniref:Cytochrome b561 domain-containing protein n=1 Tax=Hibiscus syriacus TaxID=106335 RepID=A0A6A3CPE7_HIBSY|nr:Cytochrome b561 domain-containing protein [Hibiscus syriacus]